MGSPFLVEPSKVEDRQSGGTAGSRHHSPPAHRDKEKRRPLEYSCFSFVLCSSSSSSWCWEVLCLFICLLSPFSALPSTSPFTSSTISCIYELQTGGKERGYLFFVLPPFLFPSPIHTSLHLSTHSFLVHPPCPSWSLFSPSVQPPFPIPCSLTASVTSSTHQLLLLLNPPVG